VLMKCRVSPGRAKFLAAHNPAPSAVGLSSTAHTMLVTIEIKQSSSAPVFEARKDGTTFVGRSRMTAQDDINRKDGIKVWVRKGLTGAAAVVHGSKGKLSPARPRTVYQQTSSIAACPNDRWCA
jgi:hypothetical protein